ncbi:AHH domain-containing protein [Aurantiacibacter zhengii]|nr:AHH domain-containing protein [Aurantiacibacter zhengii]
MNVRGQPGFQPDMQRHHLLPCQLLGITGLSHMLRQLGREQIGFDDFRRNGMLLPTTESAALRVAMPLHRGPHADYNAMVTERVGQIESDWSDRRASCQQAARVEALFRIQLLQRALRMRLLQAGRRRLRLNRNDPFRAGQDFAELDAMVDQLWAATSSPLN